MLASPRACPSPPETCPAPPGMSFTSLLQLIPDQSLDLDTIDIVVGFSRIDLLVSFWHSKGISALGLVLWWENGSCFGAFAVLTELNRLPSWGTCVYLVLIHHPLEISTAGKKISSPTIYFTTNPNNSAVLFFLSMCKHAWFSDVCIELAFLFYCQVD